ncbi:MAG: MarR family transcriptional regulator [Armatimonadota bacterium]|nr:MarR family transcriptional regulator [Armatimonadota bacterium]
MSPGGGPSLLQECLRAARVISRCLSEHLAVLGVTPAQVEVLSVLQRREGLSLSALSDALCCVESNVTALVDRMERDGLVERRRDGEDRRMVRLFLAPLGREKLERLAELGGCSGLLGGVLTPEEEATLRSLLVRLVDGLRHTCPPGGCAGACGKKEVEKDG